MSRRRKNVMIKRKNCCTGLKVFCGLARSARSVNNAKRHYTFLKLSKTQQEREIERKNIEWKWLVGEKKCAQKKQKEEMNFQPQVSNQ